MGNNKNLSDFTNMTRDKMGDVLKKEEYAVPILNTLGPRNCLESFKKFMNHEKAKKAIRNAVKGVNLGSIGIQPKIPDRLKQNELKTELEH